MVCSSLVCSSLKRHTLRFGLHHPSHPPLFIHDIVARYSLFKFSELNFGVWLMGYPGLASSMSSWIWVFSVLGRKTEISFPPPFSPSYSHNNVVWYLLFKFSELDLGVWLRLHCWLGIFDVQFTINFLCSSDIKWDFVSSTLLTLLCIIIILLFNTYCLSFLSWILGSDWDYPGLASSVPSWPWILVALSMTWSGVILDRAASQDWQRAVRFWWPFPFPPL